MLHEVEDGDDVGVQAAAGRARLGGKALQELVVVVDVLQDFRPQRLDRERPVDLLVVALVDDADRAAADDVVDAILADPGWARRQPTATAIARSRIPLSAVIGGNPSRAIRFDLGQGSICVWSLFEHLQWRCPSSGASG